MIKHLKKIPSKHWHLTKYLLRSESLFFRMFYYKKFSQDLFCNAKPSISWNLVSRFWRLKIFELEIERSFDKF